MEFYIHSNSAKNSLECTKAKLATHFLTEVFPIYQNKYWAIRWRDNHTDISPYYIEDCQILENGNIFNYYIQSEILLGFQIGLSKQ